jgi:integrase
VADKKKTDKTPPKQTSLSGIKQLPDGRFCLLVALTDPRTKKRKYVERTLDYGVTLGQAVDAREELLADLKAGQTPKKKQDPPTLGVYARSWLENKAPRIEVATVRAYGFALRLHILPHLGALPIAEIRRSDLERYIGWLERDSGLAVRTQQEIWSKTHTILKDAWEEYELRPVGRLKGPQGVAEPKGRALSREDLHSLVDHAGTLPDRQSSLITVLAYTGLRSLEACELRWCDLDLLDPDDAWLTVSRSKTRKGLGRRVPLPRLAVERLEKHRQTQAPSSWVWHLHGCPDRPVNTSFARQAVERSANALGLGSLTPHDLRRTYITLLDREGVNRMAMRELVGHTSNRTTDGYVRLSPADLRGALTVIEGGRKTA